MPIDAVQSGEIFTVRVYKQHAGFGWANTYEVQAAVEPINSVTAIETMASAFVSLEQLIHLTPVTIDRVVVSTYIPDGQPYNPSSFTTIPVSLPGQRTVSGDFLPLELCLFVRRNGAVGRDGRLLYRGCLLEAIWVPMLFVLSCNLQFVTHFRQFSVHGSRLHFRNRSGILF